MTGKEHAVLINQDRRRKPNRADAGRDLLDLLPGMGARILRVRLYLIDSDKAVSERHSWAPFAELTRKSKPTVCRLALVYKRFLSAFAYEIGDRL